jgi:hypothetical protein
MLAGSETTDLEIDIKRMPQTGWMSKSFLDTIAMRKISSLTASISAAVRLHCSLICFNNPTICTTVHNVRGSKGSVNNYVTHFLVIFNPFPSPVTSCHT